MTHKRKHRSNTQFESLESRLLMAAGALDNSFSFDGTTALDFGNGVKLFATDVASLPDGKTIVVGTAAPSSGTIIDDFAVARLNFDGSLDRTFGPNGSGFARTSSGNGKEADPKCVAIQNDGKILVAGNFNNGSGRDFEWAVFRYTANGTLDFSFNSGGKRTIDFKGQINDIVVQSNGKIVLVGEHNDAGFLSSANYNFGIARLNADGKLDGTFSDDGKAQAGFGGEDVAEAVALDSSGRIVVAGDRFPNGLALTRYNTNGSRDTTFGDQGLVIRTFANQSRLDIKGMLIQPGGNIVVVGSANDSSSAANSQFALARFTPAGLLDLTFGTNRNGFVKTPFGFESHAFDVIRSADKGLIVSGNSGGKLALAGYTENGLPNPSFGSAGQVQTNIPVNLVNVGLAQVPGTRRFVAASGTGFQTTRLLDKGANVVSLSAGKQTASETPAGAPRDIGTLTINRTEVLPVRTRVFFDIGGTAQNANSLSSVDYDMSGMSIVNTRGGLPFVDIQPGKNAQVFSLVPRDNSTLEPPESAVFSILNTGGYEIGDAPARTIAIADDDQVHVNFQTNDAAVPVGFVKDIGEVFGFRNGLTYGWDTDITGAARTRNNVQSPDPRYDTLIKMQEGGVNHTWEIAVPDGMYEVRVVSGDPNFIDSIYKLNLEDVTAVTGTPRDDIRWFRRWINVQVNDGRLTLSNSGNGTNNKVCFIDIRSANIGAVNGNITEDVAVHLLPPAAARSFSRAWRPITHSIFSDERIEDLV
ncbi:MAG: delta-60 repeat domain-containing protein [Tepidisphaeraceae bacterium]